MCIIVYKPMGESCPSWKTLKTCYENNPNGCGFMFAENDAVHIHKGFMSWRSFKTAFKPYKNREDLPIVLHFRITTNGATIPQNTHPFPLTSNVGELKELNIDCNVGIAHNGIISLTSYANKISDTMEFIRKYGDCIITSPQWYYNANSGKLLAEVIKSKMLVLSNDGHGEIVGTGWENEDGIWYSNSTYKSWETRYKTYRGYSAYDSYDYWNNYWESPSWKYEKETWLNADTDTDTDDEKEYTDPWECNLWEKAYPSLECYECDACEQCWTSNELYYNGATI